tara:strand:+ start:268 stop:486 length:219 start_codon:yes stop_codon:yes gene_type:complete
MKVGDLVELSAAGKKIQCNGIFVGLLGIIVQQYSGWSNPYRIHWIGKGTFRGVWFKRRELKHVRKQKTNENR